MGPRITLRDIARETGMSIATVSLSLAGDQRIARRTRERIRAVAASLGYIRDPVLASLASNRFRHTGKPARIAVSMNKDGIRRLEPQAKAMGMTLVPMDGPIASLQAGAEAQGASALIIHRRGVDVACLDPQTLPTVLWMDEGPINANIPFDIIETCEWWTATAGAIETLRRQGHRRPVAILVPAQPRHWHDDVRIACAQRLDVPAYEWSGDDIAAATLVKRCKADALLVGTRRVHLHLLKQGVQLPTVSLIVHDDPQYVQYAGWVPDEIYRGQMTLDLIEQRLRYGFKQPRRIIIQPRWQEGTSLHP